MEYPRVEWTRDTIRVFRTFLSRKEFPRFPSRCERFRKRGRRRFFSPSTLMARGSSFREETNFPFWCTRSRASVRREPRFFFFPLWKEKPIKGKGVILFFDRGEEVPNAARSKCYQLRVDIINSCRQTGVKNCHFVFPFLLFFYSLLLYRFTFCNFGIGRNIKSD